MTMPFQVGLLCVTVGLVGCAAAPSARLPEDRPKVPAAAWADGEDADDDGVPDDWLQVACGESASPGGQPVKRQGSAPAGTAEELIRADANCADIAAQGSWQLQSFVCKWWECSNATDCNPWFEDYITPGSCFCDRVDTSGDGVIDAVNCVQEGTQNGLVGCGSCERGSGTGTGSGDTDGDTSGGDTAP